MTKNLVIWDSAAVPKACVLHRHSEIEDPWELHEGVPRAATFPADCTYTLDPEFPRHTLLVDNLINRDGLVVVSLRLRRFLEARGVRKVEYLPVTILDHRGQPASRDHAIAHPIDNVDCLDLERSGARVSAIDPETIQEVKRLVLDEGRLDPERELFRMQGFNHIVLASRGLAEALDAQGFTGLRWIELANFH